MASLARPCSGITSSSSILSPATLSAVLYCTLLYYTVQFGPRLCFTASP